MSCLHGMVGAFCAICNGCCRPREDGHPVAHPDDEPRFAKGRDSAKWIGRGASIKLDAHAGAHILAAQGSIHRRPLASDWRHSCDAAAERRVAHVQAPTTVAELAILAAVRHSVHHG